MKVSPINYSWETLLLFSRHTLLFFFFLFKISRSIIVARPLRIPGATSPCKRRKRGGRKRKKERGRDEEKKGRKEKERKRRRRSG